MKYYYSMTNVENVQVNLHRVNGRLTERCYPLNGRIDRYVGNKVHLVVSVNAAGSYRQGHYDFHIFKTNFL